MQEKLRHYVLFTYSLSNISQKLKVKFIRELSGYKNVKGKKTYFHNGLLQETKAEKLAQNVIMVPIENALQFSGFFNSNKIKVEAKEIWVK